MVRAALSASLVLVVCLVLSGIRVERTQAQWVDPCAGYSSYSSALSMFISLGGPMSDPTLMDGDGDGFPCEHLTDAPGAASTAPVGVYPRGGNTGGPPPAPEASPSLPVGGVTDPPTASPTPAVPDSGGEAGPGTGPDLDTLPGEIAPDAISIYARVVGDDDNAGLFVYGVEAPGIGRFAVADELTISTVDVLTGIVIDVGTTDGTGRLTLDAEYGVPFYVVASGDTVGSRQYVMDTGMSLGVHVTSFVAGDGLPVGGVIEPPTTPEDPGFEGDPVNNPDKGGVDLPVAGVVESPVSRTAATARGIGSGSVAVMALPSVGSGPVTGLMPSLLTLMLALGAGGAAIVAVRSMRFAPIGRATRTARRG